MTALALPAPRLLRADILKFRRRRGLAVVVGVLTIVAITLTYAIIELFHVANAAKYGAAGGLDNLANGTNLVATLGAAAAAIVGGVAAVGDRDAGVYRDLVVTGRSRVALLLSRMLGGHEAGELRIHARCGGKPHERVGGEFAQRGLRL